MGKSIYGNGTQQRNSRIAKLPETREFLFFDRGSAERVRPFQKNSIITVEIALDKTFVFQYKLVNLQ